MALVVNGKISLYCFLLSFSSIFPIFLGYFKPLSFIIEGINWLLIYVIYSVFINSIIFRIYHKRGYAYQVAWRSSFLGAVCSLGLLTLSLGPKLLGGLGIYMVVLSWFHFSEYLVTAACSPRTLNIDSFLLNHSKEYGLAAVLSWLEYLLELWVLPDWKAIPWIQGLGLFLCVGGELLRKSAMIKAGHNFTHLIQMHRQPGHTLVTDGVYALCRHPAYVGWFYWSIGTQLVLCNPICFVCYTIATWNFFRKRIICEEITLLNFFGEDYLRYQRKVPTGLPFIRGYKIDF